MIILVLAVLAAGVAHVIAQDRVTFFYVVNESDRPAHVVVSADGRELFAVDLEAAGGGRPRGRELKVPLSIAATSLAVEDLDSGLHALVDLSQVPRSRAGFRIVVRATDITVARDYFPIRTR